MKVTLRKRNQGGKTSLYLDYYHKGKRNYEYLNLYLNPDANTKEQRLVNKETFQLAKNICAKRQLEVQNGLYGFPDFEKLQASFITYIEQLIEKRKDSIGNRGNWASMLKHLKAFTGSDITFSQVTKQFVEEFKYYLDKTAKTRSNKGLSQNSKQSYFNKFRAAINQAISDGILIQNPIEGVKAFKQEETERPFLTLEELQSLVNIECDVPLLKNAFLFSCLSGLRWGDIVKLAWSEIEYSEELGYFIRFRQNKTKGVETLPISDEAYQLLGDRKGGIEIVFKGLSAYTSRKNIIIKKWISQAGISKNITYHCSRHTYATLQIAADTELFTVSKLLGHKNIKTTQIYANIIDKKKKEAANRVKLKI